MRKLILVAQFLEILALAIWVGGLIIIVAAVIPAVFNTIGMETGGRMLTRTFQGYDRLIFIAAGLLIIGMVTRQWLPASHAKVSGSELWIALGMVAVAVFLTFYWNPETVRLQEAAFAAQEEAAKRTAYDAFFRAHWMARGLYLVNLGLGLIVLFVKVKQWAR